MCCIFAFLGASLTKKIYLLKAIRFLLVVVLEEPTTGGEKVSSCSVDCRFSLFFHYCSVLYIVSSTLFKLHPRANVFVDRSEKLEREQL